MSNLPENQYLKISIKNVLDELEPIVVQFCFEHGASGVAEDLSFEQTSRDYVPEIVVAPVHNLNVFFETFPDILYLNAIIIYKYKITNLITITINYRGFALS